MGLLRTLPWSSARMSRYSIISTCKHVLWKAGEKWRDGSSGATKESIGWGVGLGSVGIVIVAHISA